MKWSFRIASFAGTEVRVHATFFLLLVFVAMQGLGEGRGMAGVVQSVTMVLAMFACVVLHEFGHVQAAKLYGIRTPDVTLLPIGGVARLERMPSRPAHELVVAIAGPLVNVVIAAVIGLTLDGTARLDLDFHFTEGREFWVDLMRWNIMMVVFNMIPAFPMDGGRVLRAFLALFTGYGRATRLAATVGQAIAMVTVTTMLLLGRVDPFIVLIALFIFFAAGQEAAMVTQREQTADLRVRDAMLTDIRALPERATLRDAVDLMLAGSQHDFPVTDERGSLLGMVTRARLVQALAEHGPGFPVDQILESCAEPLAPEDELGAAMDRLGASPLTALPVVSADGGSLAGLLTAENVAELLMVRQAMTKRA